MPPKWYGQVLALSAVIVLPALADDWNSFAAGFTLAFVLCAAAFDHYSRMLLDKP